MEIINYQSTKWFLSDEESSKKSTIELILQGSDTTGQHTEFYGVTVAHVFLSESQQRVLINDSDPSTVMSVWKEVEASSKERKYVMSTGDRRFPSVDVVGPPYLFYRHWCHSRSTGYPLVDIALFKLDQKQLQETHQLMREVHSQPGEKTSRLDRIKIASSKVKEIESLEDLYHLIGRKIYCRGKFGHILNHLFYCTDQGVVVQNLSFRMDDDERLQLGDFGSLVYLMGDDVDQQSYIVGMFSGVFIEEPRIHQAVILSKALSMIGESQPFQQMNLEIPTSTNQSEIGIGGARQGESKLVQVSEPTDEVSSENCGDGESSVDRIPGEGKTSVSGETEKAESQCSETPGSPSFTGDPSPVERLTTGRPIQEESELVKASTTTDEASSENYDGESPKNRIADEAKTSVSGEARQGESKLVQVSETTDEVSSENCGDSESSAGKTLDEAKTSVSGETEKAESQTSETPGSPSLTGDPSPVERSTTEHQDSDTRLEANSKESEAPAEVNSSDTVEELCRKIAHQAQTIADLQKVLAELSNPKEEKMEGIKRKLKTASNRTGAEHFLATSELSRSKTEQYAPHILDEELNLVLSKKIQPQETSEKASKKASDPSASANFGDDDDDDDDDYISITQDDVDQIASVCKEYNATSIEVLQNPFRHREVLVTCVHQESNRQELTNKLNIKLKNYDIDVSSKPDETALEQLGWENSLTMNCMRLWQGKCELIVQSTKDQSKVFAVSAAHVLFSDKKNEEFRHEEQNVKELRQILKDNSTDICLLYPDQKRASSSTNEGLVFYHYNYQTQNEEHTAPRLLHQKFLMDAFLLPLECAEAVDLQRKIRNYNRCRVERLKTITSEEQLQSMHKSRTKIKVKDFNGCLFHRATAGDNDVNKKKGLRLEFRLNRESELKPGDSGSIVYHVGRKIGDDHELEPMGMLACRVKEKGFDAYSAVVLSQLFDEVQHTYPKRGNIQLFHD